MRVRAIKGKIDEIITFVKKYLRALLSGLSDVLNSDWRKHWGASTSIGIFAKNCQALMSYKFGSPKFLQI